MKLKERNQVCFLSNERVVLQAIQQKYPTEMPPKSHVAIKPSKYAASKASVGKRSSSPSRELGKAKQSKKNHGTEITGKRKSCKRYHSECVTTDDEDITYAVGGIEAQGKLMKSIATEQTAAKRRKHSVYKLTAGDEMITSPLIETCLKSVAAISSLALKFPQSSASSKVSESVPSISRPPPTTSVLKTIEMDQRRLANEVYELLGNVLPRTVDNMDELFRSGLFDSMTLEYLMRQDQMNQVQSVHVNTLN